MGFQEELSHQWAQQQTHPGRTVKVAPKQPKSIHDSIWGGRVSAIIARGRRRWRIISNYLIPDPAAHPIHPLFYARGNHSWKWSEQTYQALTRAPPDPLANFGFPKSCSTFKLDILSIRMLRQSWAIYCNFDFCVNRLPRRTLLSTQVCKSKCRKII